MLFISTSPISAIKTPAIEKNPSAIVIEKGYFANIHSSFTGQEK